MSSASNATLSTANPLAQCYSYENYAAVVLQSVGLVADQLCPQTGIFVSALSGIEDCILASITTNYCGYASSITSAVPLLNSGVQLCQQAGQNLTVWGAISQQCFNEQGEDLGSSLRSYCSAASAQGTAPGICQGAATTTNAQISSSGSSTASSLSTAAISAPTASSNPAATRSNTGTIVGIAVGVTIAAILLIVGVGWFIYRRRKQNKSRSTAAVSGNEHTPEKAQLHSDDVKPDRKELIGTIPRRQSRRVGGLSELPATESHSDGHKGPTEMMVNEVVGSEMQGSSNTSTKVESHSSLTR